MNVALRRPMTLEEFLAWGREQEFCYEFDGIQPILMNGGTLRHYTICADILFALETRLREPWRIFGKGVKLLVAGRVQYPGHGGHLLADQGHVRHRPRPARRVTSVGTATNTLMQ